VSHQDYPIPRVPVLPVLSGASFTGGRDPGIASCLEGGEYVAVESGTEAILMALVHASIGSGDEVLVPAFHCRSMIEPVLAVGARPVHYRINPDTSVSEEDIAAHLGSRTRAILVAHYFGFPQPAIARLRRSCDDRNVRLIEDCAHAFFGVIDGVPLGVTGDYAIASVRKFFPVSDGGCLISSRHSLAALGAVPPGVVAEIKAAADIFEEASRYGRPRPLNLLSIPLFGVKRLLRSTRRERHAPDAPASEAFQYLDRSVRPRRMSRASQFIMRRASRARIVGRRRDNYSKLVAGLRGLNGARPLLPELRDGVVPYMFPLLIDDADNIFPRLKRRGVPIFRWEDTPAGICPVTDRFRSDLLQIPCHQELRASEINWLVDTIRNTTG
jgi:dTDP-4-amino-4,6-dideoxygalactose transaminase